MINRLIVVSQIYRINQVFPTMNKKRSPPRNANVNFQQAEYRMPINFQEKKKKKGFLQRIKHQSNIRLFHDNLKARRQWSNIFNVSEENYP